jgi:hypothetical protein
MSGPNETIRPIPSWPPIWGVLILVIGFPSGPAAVPALVCRSGIIVRYLFVLSPTSRLAATKVGRIYWLIVLTTLTNTRIEDLCENLVFAWGGDRIVFLEFNRATEIAD